MNRIARDRSSGEFPAAVFGKVVREESRQDQEAGQDEV